MPATNLAAPAARPARAAALIALSELTSNTATANIFYPILSAAAVVGLGVDPLLLWAVMRQESAFRVRVRSSARCCSRSRRSAAMRSVVARMASSRRALSSGVYFARLETAGGSVDTSKLTLLK